MAVEPAGFNTTHELISAMTYSKAPEFVRMCQLILEKKFDHALHNYHTKYAFPLPQAINGLQLWQSLHQRMSMYLNGQWLLKRTGKSAIFT